MKTQLNRKKHVIVVGVLSFFGICLSTYAADPDVAHSGFLGDSDVYEKLEKVEISDGREAYRWIGPKLSFANYKSVLINDVVLYPVPEPSEQVSAETLEDITNYATDILTQKVGEVVRLSEAPGEQVVGFQAAITAVEIKTEGMKAYEIVPIAGIFGAIKAAAGKRARDLYVRIEVRFVDTLSGELVGAVVRHIEGEQLEGKKDQLELDHVQDSLDQAIGDGASMAEDMLSAE